MRTQIILALALTFAAATAARADDPQRFVERAPLPHTPPAHTPERAGTTLSIAPWAVPGVSNHETGGYVGGGGLVRGDARGPSDGTFGWDYVLFGRRPGRAFLGFLNDRPHQSALAPRYATDGRKVPDPIAAQPLRRAAREAIAEKREGGR